MAATGAEVVAALRGDRHLGPQLAAAIELEGRPVRPGRPERELPEALGAALIERGIDHLWSHQAAALDAVRAGRDVLVTTPTASGKSLIFQLPVLEEALTGGDGRALFLFPLKALGRDQKLKLDALAAAAGLEPCCEIYDGDTPGAVRRRVRRRPPRVLITNPDMLHLGILGHWPQWAPFLRDLRWVVMDELHTYRGVFGSHFHHVLYRLERLCAVLGAAPTLIASSATAANAERFAAALARREMLSIAESGAPREKRHLLLFRPEVSPYTTALRLLVSLVDAGSKTIVFSKARRITELLYAWLSRQRPDLAHRVASYRSGFLPEERRDIERRLAGGELEAVISTSALEMGIDIGGLDACVLVGFPGSVMSTWQRSGRVGRQGRESITALVALPDALDQYMVNHPDELVGRPCEELMVDPENPAVVRAHLLCAASEKPLDIEADAAYLERHAACVGDLLREEGLARSADGLQLYAGGPAPHRRVDLRGAGESAAILEPGGRVVGTVDGVRVLHECHPGAVYLHAGRQYLVRELDLGGRRVLAEPVEVDYFTTPQTEKTTEILEVLAERDDGRLHAGLGRLRVTERVVGFERKQIRSREVLDVHELELPPVRFETVGLWWLAPPAVEQLLTLQGEHFMGALHAGEHAAIALLPRLAICDRGDIGGISQPLHPQLRCGGVFVYDGHSGGAGIAARAFEQLPRLLGDVVDLLERCPCEEGCPSCVQSPKCGNGNRPLDKAGAARLLRLLLGRESPELRWESPRAAGVDAAAPPVMESTPPAPARRGGTGGTLVFQLVPQLTAEQVGGHANAHRMRLAAAALYHLQEGWMELFREEDVPRLVARLREAALVVGFDNLDRGYRVLEGYTGIDYGQQLPTLDLLSDVERLHGLRPRLENLARATLGADGASGGPPAGGVEGGETGADGRASSAGAEEHCQRAVETLRDLYLFGRRMGFVRHDGPPGARRELEVDW